MEPTLSNWMNKSSAIVEILVLSSLLTPLALLGADQGHEALATSSEMTFAEVFAHALENSPEAMETPVREQQAQDYSSTGKSFLSGRPSLQLSYYDDGIIDSTGLTEMEYGVQLPLWRPGQRQDTRQMGRNYSEQVEAWKEALALSVAGKVRAVLGAIALAELEIQLQQQAVADAQQLNDITNTLFAAGEVARLELLQTQSMLLEQRSELLSADAMLVDAERLYNTLTGLEIRPDRPYQEAQIADKDIDGKHPGLHYLHTAIDLADSNIKQNERVAMGNPQLTVGSRRERADQFQNYISSIGISLSIPFGGKSFVSAQTSSARRAKVDAEVLYQNSYLALNQALHEVEHELFLLQQAEPLRQAQFDLSQQRHQMARTAYEVAETTLAQVVIAQQEAQQSERALKMLLLERQQLITEFNQILGELP
jgi:cobalt-zinc-cadmium efflux system outer membrane protein